MGKKKDYNKIPLSLRNDYENPEKLYNYALSLYKVKAFEEARVYFKLAANKGHKPSKIMLRKMNKKKHIDKYDFINAFLVFLMTILILTLISMFIYDLSNKKTPNSNTTPFVFSQQNQVEKKSSISSNINNPSEKNEKKISPKKISKRSLTTKEYLKEMQSKLKEMEIEKPEKLSLELEPLTLDLNNGQVNPSKQLLNMEKLELMVVHSALKNYKKINGFYPKNLKELTKNKPKNFLTYIPENMELVLGDNFYVLKNKSEIINSEEKNILEIDFYPFTNEIVITFGNLPLSKYKVASGREKLPFKKSEIQERVVNPNNGIGPLGTRGLVLEDNYAIHGTNNPNSIGNYVSLGCIRLLNANIELVYPYISLGTIFNVKENNPPKPILKNGLPNLIPKEKMVDFENKNQLNKDLKSNPENESNDFPNETEPNKTFKWRK